MTSPEPPQPTEPPTDTPNPPATTTATTTTTTTTARSTPPPDPKRPTAAPEAALFDAIATENATLYGYGLVSARTTPDLNDLVAGAMAEHRDRREAAIALLAKSSVESPSPAPGYQVPGQVENPTDAAKLAVSMEKDAATAWRAVLEKATSEEVRTLAVKALTQSAVATARWNRSLEVWPISSAFPGGREQH